MSHLASSSFGERDTPCKQLFSIAEAYPISFECLKKKGGVSPFKEKFLNEPFPSFRAVGGSHGILCVHSRAFYPA